MFPSTSTLAKYPEVREKHTQQIITRRISHMGLCPKCQGIIEWRKKYRKYKPLKAPRKCGSCSKRAIVRAYHVICGPCRSAKQVCAKCLLPCNQWKSVGGGEEEEEEEEAGGAQADNNPNGNHVDTNESKPNDGIYEEEDKKGAVVDTETNEEKSVNPSSSKPQPTRKELNER
eukprot:jgi/Bigna1/137754/aug1.41_g12462